MREMTQQYLKILEVKYINQIPKIAGIDVNQVENKVTAYVEVKNEYFYLQFVFDTTSNIQIYSVSTVPFIGINFTPTSEELTLEHLLKITSINPTSTISKEEFEYNGLVFDSNPEPGQIENKLNLFLNLLESDIEGIKELSKQTNCKHLFLTIIYHAGTENYSGFYLTTQIINRLSNLGFELTFDIYASGNKFL